MSYFKRYLWWIVGALSGMLAGFLYWRFVGCSSGSCPITSNPYMSMFWFGLIGLLLVPSKKKGGKHEEQE